MNPLRGRLGQHLCDINLKKDTSVANHFNSHIEDPLESFKITPLITIKDLERRKALEMKFIRNFNTLAPNGLNDRFDPYNTYESLNTFLK